MKGTNHQIALIMASVWPEPTSSAAGWRMKNLILTLITEGYDIHYWTTATESNYAMNLDALGVQSALVPLNDSQLDEQLKKLNPDLVIFDRFMVEEQFGWRVQDQCPNALRVLNTEDLHCLRASRLEAFKKQLEWKPSMLLESETAKRELASIFRSDLTMIISTYEMSLLRDLFQVPESILCYLPFEAEKGSQTLYEEREQFVSIGNFMHQPNWQAVLDLKQHIWPRIRKQLPKAELHIYGAYPTEKVFNLHNEKEGFLIKGKANSAEDVIGNAKVLLAPLSFGAGQKGKLLEAMQFGTPSVTTVIGAEGMAEFNKWNGFVVDDWAIFADKAVELYSNEQGWNEAVVKGNALLITNFSIGYLENAMHRMAEIQTKLSEHRKGNFVGKMLQYHQFRSTKYMSKWIEAKNSLKD